ncbi:hypothetical protein [Vagococcus luciliae]|uniref:Uncharacterized protein n=1 Tax=Vagococcus luciliae TaxID=2920380 RepID=A0ABY5NXM3_9ENTE|nr:hypothetical protein [Vagococcus luciliae]UUV98401.1 hypothetical protein G314FT_05170 [Vagococcus luciliae]
MNNKKIGKELEDALMKISFIQNNLFFAAEVFDDVKSKESDTREQCNLKLYDFERIGRKMETTFNYVDFELEELFQILNECINSLD